MYAHSPIRFVDVTPVLDTSAYTAGDTLFNSTAIPNATGPSGEPARLISLTVIDTDDQAAAVTTLFFFDSLPTTFGTLNSAPSITDADALKSLGSVVIPSANFLDVGGAKIASMDNINKIIKSAPGTRTIYVAGMTAGTPTQTASGILLRFGFADN